MNRAERRKLKLKNTEPTYNVKKSELHGMKNHVTTITTKIAFKLMLGIPLMVLHDKYGFGKKRLTEFSDYVFDLYDSFEKNYITMEEIEECIFEETGVKYR